MGAENSEVFPAASVAVAVTARLKANGTGTSVGLKLKLTKPPALVVTFCPPKEGPALVRAGGAEEELQRERRAGRALEGAAHKIGGVREHGMVLAQVGAGVGVGGVVRGHAVLAQVDAEAGVRVIEFCARRLPAPAGVMTTPGAPLLKAMVFCVSVLPLDSRRTPPKFGNEPRPLAVSPTRLWRIIFAPDVIAPLCVAMAKPVLPR